MSTSPASPTPLPTFDEILAWATATEGASVAEKTEDDCLLVQADEERPDCVLRLEPEHLLLQFFFEESFDADEALRINSELLEVARLAVTDDGDFYLERRVLRPWLGAGAFQLELEGFLEEVLRVLDVLVDEPEDSEPQTH